MKLPCKWNNFSKQFEISNRFEFTSDRMKGALKLFVLQLPQLKLLNLGPNFVHSNNSTLTWDPKEIQTGLQSQTTWKIVQFTWHFHAAQTWDLKPLSKIVPCDNFPNHCKILIHMRKLQLLINASLINAKQILRWWLFSQWQ